MYARAVKSYSTTDCPLSSSDEAALKRFLRIVNQFPNMHFFEDDARNYTFSPDADEITDVRRIDLSTRECSTDLLASKKNLRRHLYPAFLFPDQWPIIAKYDLHVCKFADPDSLPEHQKCEQDLLRALEDGTGIFALNICTLSIGLETEVPSLTTAISRAIKLGGRTVPSKTEITHRESITSAHLDAFEPWVKSGLIDLEFAWSFGDKTYAHGDQVKELLGKTDWGKLRKLRKLRIGTSDTHPSLFCSEIDPSLFWPEDTDRLRYHIPVFAADPLHLEEFTLDITPLDLPDSGPVMSVNRGVIASMARAMLAIGGPTCDYVIAMRDYCSQQVRDTWDHLLDKALKEEMEKIRSEEPVGWIRNGRIPDLIQVESAGSCEEAV